MPVFDINELKQMVEEALESDENAKVTVSAATLADLLDRYEDATDEVAELEREVGRIDRELSNTLELLDEQPADENQVPLDFDTL